MLQDLVLKFFKPKKDAPTQSTVHIPCGSPASQAPGTHPHARQESVAHSLEAGSDYVSRLTSPPWA